MELNRDSNCDVTTPPQSVRPKVRSSTETVKSPDIEMVRNAVNNVHIPTPTRNLLDSIFNKNGVFIERRDSHSGPCNSKRSQSSEEGDPAIIEKCLVSTNAGENERKLTTAELFENKLRQEAENNLTFDLNPSLSKSGDIRDAEKNLEYDDDNLYEEPLEEDLQNYETFIGADNQKGFMCKDNDLYANVYQDHLNNTVDFKNQEVRQTTPGVQVIRLNDIDNFIQQRKHHDQICVEDLKLYPQPCDKDVPPFHVSTKSYTMYFCLPKRALDENRTYSTPEFDHGGLLFSCLFYPNGFDKSTPDHLYAAIQINSYKFEYRTSVDFSLSLLCNKDKTELYKMKSGLFLLNKRSTDDGFMEPIRIELPIMYKPYRDIMFPDISEMPIRLEMTKTKMLTTPEVESRVVSWCHSQYQRDADNAQLLFKKLPRQQYETAAKYVSQAEMKAAEVHKAEFAFYADAYMKNAEESVEVKLRQYDEERADETAVFNSVGGFDPNSSMNALYITKRQKEVDMAQENWD